jgi:phage terminase large subunit GpA-like protein
MYTCNICYCSFGDKCVGDNQDILKNPIMHNGHFYCGDEATDCYISQEEAQSVLGDADIVRFFVQCSGCGEYEFLSLAEKQAQLCPTCNVCYSCNDCRVESLDEEYYPTWKCLKCTHVAHLKEAEYEFNRRWNDYL